MSASVPAERPRIRVPAGSSTSLSTASENAFMHLRSLQVTGVAGGAATIAPATQPATPGADQDRHPDGKFKGKDKDEGEGDGDEGDPDEEGDDESDDEETRGKRGKSAARARSRERARCAAIFGSEHAAANVEMAAHLAFGTNLTRSQAIATLAKTPSGGGLAAAMRQIPNAPVGPGAATEAPTGKSIAKGWDHAFAKHEQPSARKRR